MFSLSQVKQVLLERRQLYSTILFQSLFGTKSQLSCVKNLQLPGKLLCSITFTYLKTYEAFSSTDPSKASGVIGIPSKFGSTHPSRCTNQFITCFLGVYASDKPHTKMW